MRSQALAGISFSALLALAPVGAGAQQKRDSIEARRRAVSLQNRFEMVRRTNLPLEYSGSRGDCDAHIGRFCQWNDDEDTIEAEQPRVIRRARQSLIASLDSLALRSPHDGWITGQRVRYLIEIRNDTAALRAALECRAAEWWCAALVGLALHEGRNTLAADSAFAHALRTMPLSERCKWTDMTPLLDPSLRSRLKKVGCGTNDEVAERLWWLADPFWSLPGNDRRTEHYARNAMARIQEPARNAYNLSWSKDLREMIVRYGWARYWTRRAGTPLEPDNGAVSGHEATPNYHFVPVSFTTDTAPDVKFDLDEQASPERYSSVNAKRIFEIEPQVAVFHRGDSARVIVAYDVGLRHELDSIPVSGALAVASDEHSPITLSTDTAGRHGALSAMVGARSQIISLEAIDTVAHRAAAWSRSVLHIAPLTPNRVALSDPLLFLPGQSDVSGLESAMKSAIGGNSVPRGKVGVYWEMYGLPPSDSTLPISLTLTRVDEGRFRKLGQSIGLVSRRNPLRIQWNHFATGAIACRAIVLDLELIPRGEYLLSIEAGPAGTSRMIELSASRQ